MPKDARKRYDTLQWLFFQVAHIGPMFGQANHFNGQAKDNQYARDRYNNESLRLYRVLENRLRESQWIACDEYTIADIATYPWCKGHKDRGIDRTAFPNFMRWFEAMEARPAVQRNNQMATKIRARMEKAAESRPHIDIYDTKDNAERLAGLHRQGTTESREDCVCMLVSDKTSADLQGRDDSRVLGNGPGTTTSGSRQGLMSVQRAGCPEIFRPCLVALLPMRLMAHRQLSGVERESMRCLETISLKKYCCALRGRSKR